MRSESAMYLAVSLLRLKLAIVAATPVLAYATEQTVFRSTSASALSLLTWAFIVGFSMLGWAVADLDKLAELWNLEGKSAYEKWKARLSLAKTIAASCAAGVCMFFLGRLVPGLVLTMLGVSVPGAAPEIPEMLLLIFTTGAGYMGARWFDLFEKRFLAR